MSIANGKINVSLLMMRECQMLMNVSAVENDSYTTHLDSFYFHIHCSPQSQWANNGNIETADLSPIDSFDNIGNERTKKSIIQF